MGRCLTSSTSTAAGILWRDMVALRRAQATPAAEQPTLFALREDHRPAGERNAAKRYREPNLFTVIERSR
jgi:hypothetical protein